MPVHITCSVCGTPFPVRGKIRKAAARFCSRRCRFDPRFGVVINDRDMTALVPLWGSGGVLRGHVLIDAADVERVTRWRWSLHAMGGYAMRHGGTLLHRELLGLTPGDGMEGDHINRDRLDCRRANLRPIPAMSGNRQNLTPMSTGTSRFRGVSWHAHTGKWCARAWQNGRGVYLGVYESETEAADIAREARRRLMPYATD